MRAIKIRLTLKAIQWKSFFLLGHGPTKATSFVIHCPFCSSKRKQIAKQLIRHIDWVICMWFDPWQQKHIGRDELNNNKIVMYLNAINIIVIKFQIVTRISYAQGYAQTHTHTKSILSVLKRVKKWNLGNVTYIVNCTMCTRTHKH